MKVAAALALALAVVGLGGAPAERADARDAATCSPAKKRTAQTALAKYRRAMPKQRAAYFRTHKRPAQRRAFVRRQQQKLERLRRAAACTVVRPKPPPPPPPAPPPPPPAPPPAPADTTAPQLAGAAVDGATLTVRFDEPVSAANADFALHVDGAPRGVVSVGASGSTVVLTLAQPAGPSDVARLDYRGGVTDAAGNAALPVAGVVVANATPAPCSFMVANGGLAGPGAMNEGPTDMSLHLPATGVLRGIVLWVDFSDAPAGESIASLTDTVFAPASAAYASMSYGRFSLDVTAAPRWYRLPQPSAYYGLKGSDGPGRKDEYIAAAIAAADHEIDFRPYEVVYVVPAAGAAADFATATQRPRGSGFATLDGTELRHAVLLGTEPVARDPVAAVVHETSHALGLPDLYGEFTAVGGWDPMSFPVRPGPELIAWHRWKLGWLEPSQLRCADAGKTVEATLAPLDSAGGVKALVAPLGSTRALVVENRRPLGLDSGLCDAGVLVYTVDGTVTFPGAPVRVLPASPGSDTDEAKRQRCGPRYDAPLDLGAGEIAGLDAGAGVRVDVIARVDADYVVRVSR